MKKLQLEYTKFFIVRCKTVTTISKFKIYSTLLTLTTVPNWASAASIQFIDMAYKPWRHTKHFKFKKMYIKMLIYNLLRIKSAFLIKTGMHLSYFSTFIGIKTNILRERKSGYKNMIIVMVGKF